MNSVTGNWFVVKDAVAREKVGQVCRDAVAASQEGNGGSSSDVPMSPTRSPVRSRAKSVISTSSSMPLSPSATMQRSRSLNDDYVSGSPAPSPRGNGRAVISASSTPLSPSALLQRSLSLNNEYLSGSPAPSPGGSGRAVISASSFPPSKLLQRSLSLNITAHSVDNSTRSITPPEDPPPRAEEVLSCSSVVAGATNLQRLPFHRSFSAPMGSFQPQQQHCNNISQQQQQQQLQQLQQQQQQRVWSSTSSHDARTMNIGRTQNQQEDPEINNLLNIDLLESDHDNDEDTQGDSQNSLLRPCPTW